MGEEKELTKSIIELLVKRKTTPKEKMVQALIKSACSVRICRPLLTRQKRIGDNSFANSERDDRIRESSQ